MNQNLKHTYIRIDASGRDINNTNVTRLKKPHTGRWRQVESSDCCAASSTISSTPADVSLTSMTVVFSCDGTPVATHVIPTATTTINDVVNALNSSLSYYGTFTVNGTAIELKLSQDTATAICAGTLTFVITETV